MAPVNLFNEAAIRDIVAEVVGRLNETPTPPATPAAQAPAIRTSGRTAAPRGTFGVFRDVNEACVATGAGTWTSESSCDEQRLS